MKCEKSDAISIQNNHSFQDRKAARSHQQCHHRNSLFERIQSSFKDLDRSVVYVRRNPLSCSLHINRIKRRIQHCQPRQD